MRVRNIGRAVACALAVAMAVAACGSSGPNATSASAPPGGTPTARSSTAAQASTGKEAPFNLGSICSCSGAQAAALAELGKVSTAWADSVNAAGGINGHPVKVTVLDDGGDPATARVDLVERGRYLRRYTPQSIAP